jgi:hypothetical protein
VTLALTLAILLQSRILDSKEEAPIPAWVRHRVPIADAVAISIMAGVALIVIVLSLGALSRDKALTAGDRELLKWMETLVGLLAFWVFVVAVWRRILPVLWRRRADHPWRLERDAMVETIGVVGPVLGFVAGTSLVVGDARGLFGLLPLAAMVVAAGLGKRRGDRRRDAKQRRTQEARGLGLCEARLAGFAEGEAPWVEVLQAPEARHVWLTSRQAKDVAAAFDWAKDNISSVDDRRMRLRSVEFKDKWYRGWRVYRSGRQVFGLTISAGRGAPTKLESDESEVLCVRSDMALFAPQPGGRSQVE